MKKLFIFFLGYAFFNCLFATSIHGMDIFEAVKQGNNERVNELVAAHADVNERDGVEWETPLHRAIWLNHAEIVRILIGAGAKVDLRNSYDSTPLHIAAYKRNPAIVQMLTSAKANANLKNNCFKTPLAIAAECGLTEIARLLIAADAQADLATHEGFAPLHFAVKGGWQDIVEILLANGATIDLQDDARATPLMHGIYKIWEYNNDSGIRVFDTPAEKQWAIEKLKGVIKVLVSAGARVDLADLSGKTALQLAQEYGLSDIVQFIENYLTRREAALLGARHPRLGAHITPAMRELPIYIYQDICELLKKFDR